MLEKNTGDGVMSTLYDIGLIKAPVASAISMVLLGFSSGTGHAQYTHPITTSDSPADIARKIAIIERKLMDARFYRPLTTSDTPADRARSLAMMRLISCESQDGRGNKGCIDRYKIEVGGKKKKK